MLDRDSFPVKRTADKLAVVGLYEGTRTLVPWDDEEYDIWCLNESYVRMKDELKRFTMWWEIHPDDTIYQNIYNPTHNEWLANCGVPVIMQKKHDKIPNSVAYPIDLVTSQIWKKYISSTVAYQLIAAWMMGYKRVEFYGFTMRSQSEYFKQRPNFEYILGIIRGWGGMDIWFPEDCDILVGDFYGFEDTVQSIITSAEGRAIKRETISDKLAMDLQSSSGKLDLLQTLRKSGVSLPESILSEVASEHKSLTAQYYLAKGRAEEARELHKALFIYGKHRG